MEGEGETGVQLDVTARLRNEIADAALAYADALVALEAFRTEHPSTRSLWMRSCVYLGLIDEVEGPVVELDERVGSTQSDFYDRVGELVALAVDKTRLEVTHQEIAARQTEGRIDARA